LIPKILTMVTRGVIIKMKEAYENRRIESRLEIQTYIDGLRYALENESTKISFQKNRQIDKKRNKKFTNRYTIERLFPDDDEVEALKRELALLTIEEYVETLKDIRYPNKSEMRIFGRKYFDEDVYIKIRVELISTTHASGDSFIFVMSFHYAEEAFSDSDFPYKKK